MYPSILIVDDENSILQSLGDILSDDGFRISFAQNGYDALKKIEKQKPDLVLLDIWLPGIDGIETLQEIKEIEPNLPVVMITGHGTIESAVNAIKLGAFDFIEKPLSIDKVIVTINNALNFRKLEEENIYLKKRMIDKYSLDGRSKEILALKEKVYKIGMQQDLCVLIKGESGVGKELVARTIHKIGSRSEQDMVVVHCGRMKDDLIEEELFGKEGEEGSRSKEIGVFEKANNSTIFFDEIGDMTLKGQAAILRVLEEKKIQRLGSMRLIDTNARVIAATNMNLEDKIKSDKFRKDLFYRLDTISIEIPPLRKRISDLPILLDIFLKESAREHNVLKKEISKEAMKKLMAKKWEGNIRELKNFAKMITITNKKTFIEEVDIN